MTSLKLSVNKLVENQTRRDPLPPPVEAQPIGPGIGFSEPQSPAAASSGGIASPLTEKGYATRETYAEMTSATSDGIFTASIKPYKKLFFTDAGGRTVAYILSPPDIPAP